LYGLFNNVFLFSDGDGDNNSTYLVVAQAVFVRAETAPELGQRAEITTRSPRAIATGKGPTHTDITSTKPLVKGREVGLAKLRASKKMTEKPGGEFAQYGRQVQAEATQHALGKLAE